MTQNERWDRTRQYYAKWLDTDIDTMVGRGVTLLPTENRRICPKGHDRNLDLYAVAFPDHLLVSYLPEMEKDYPLRGLTGLAAEAGLAELKRLFPGLLHRRAHWFPALTAGIDTSPAAGLAADDYPHYLTFFLSQHPQADPDGWLEDYFHRLTANHRCYGVFAEGKLTCATGAPDMPYMEGLVTEPGIDTLPAYRHKGYALASCALYLANALARNEAPIWTCWHDNTASYRLAEKLGFQRFCDLYTIKGNVTPTS